MIWFGALVGIVLGFAFDSFPLGFMFTCAGAVFGLLVSRNDKKYSHLLLSLQQRIEAQQAHVTQLAALVAALERRLDQEPRHAASPPPDLPPLPSSEPETIVRQTILEEIPPLVVLESAVVPPPSPIAVSQETVRVPEMTVDKAARPDVIAAVVPPAISRVAASAGPTLAGGTPPGRASKPVPPAPKPPSALELLVRRWIFGGNPLVKIGVLILFLGLAFLLRYASEYIVVPIELRYAGVAAVGVALLLFGWRLRHKQDNYGLILQGAGVGVMYLTTLAAMRFNDLIAPEYGFAILVGVAAFAAALAILQDSLAMAVAGTLGGFAAPVLVSTGHDAHLALFLFLSLLNLGIVAIAWFKAWRVLNLIGFVGTFTLGIGWANKFYEPALFSATEPFLLLYFALYVLIAFLFARRVLAQAGGEDSADHTGTFGTQIRQSVARLNYVDGALVFGVPFVCFAMQYVVVKPFEYGAAFSAMGFGLFYVGLAMLLFRQSARRYLLLTETLLALAVIFGSLAIPLGLDQSWTAAAWAVEAAGMYWVGLRQQRQHGRMFALLVLAASAFTTLRELHAAPTGPALAGSALGCLLLAGSAASICWQMRKARDELSEQEAMLRPWVLALGAMFLALAPFTLLAMQWASAALAVLGVVGLFLAMRWSERLMQHLGWLYQALAGVLFVTTMHAAANGNALGNGISGLFLVSLIGTGMLVSVWLAVRHASSAASGQPASFGTVATIALLAGIVFVNLAPLFVLSLGFAALVWTLSGLATLWWAVRIRHLGAIILALLLQAAAGMAHIAAQLFVPVYVPYSLANFKPFMHSGFWGPIVISLASLLCARLLLRAASSASAGEHATVSNAKPNANLALGWISLTWSVLWWGFGWSSEIYRVATTPLFPVDLAALVIATALAWSAIARRWHWRELGLMSLLYVPALVAVATESWLLGNHPSANYGAFVWPLALLVHGWLLTQQRTWFAASSPLAPTPHVLGAWLFIVQAALELRYQFAHLGDAYSAWPLLGWMIAPVAYLLLLSYSRVHQAWPVREQRDAYLLTSVAPVAVYLLFWVWISNAISPGNASPLPYVPLINPLEIAHLAVLLGITLWWNQQREHPALRGNSPAIIAVTMATGLAMLTGIVARSCHHLGGVPWNFDDLWASTLFQTALSLTWSVVAICTMLAGNRSKQRWVWIVGASLMAVVVGKLFLIELAAKGSLARIVSFIVVGLLLLVVGYFAPLPPRRQIEKAEISSTESELPT